jgi:hypothetical protein
MARKQVQMALRRDDLAGATTANGFNILDRSPNTDDRASADFDEATRQPVGARPKSTATGRHDPGLEANETEDGLSGTEEAIRHAAEDMPDAQEDDRPVFDEADSMPKVFDDEDEAEDEEHDDEDDGDEDDDEDDEDDEDEDDEEEEEEDEEEDED